MSSEITQTGIYIRKPIISLILGVLFIGPNLGLLSVSAGTKGDTIEKVKADVTRRTGEKVVVTMKSGSKIKGVVSNVLNDSFDLLDSNTRQATTIPYRDVEKLKKQGWSTGAKVGLGVAIGAAVVAAVVLGLLAKDPLDGFCPLGC